ncbi:MAG: RagB/SusD family nutrient uptake outer membrane protein, partial [Bacteroidales bacterium]|nr:RagB/SusD family nutrient uptake outer membrane protein [Bacteroidales bacterium]
MKTLKYIFAGLVLAAGLSSCIGDLDVTPIDPSKNTADKALKTADDYYSLLAQCYTGFAVSGSYGPNGDNNISGVDGGFSQYYRGRYHLNGLTTDEAVCGWNDQTLQDLHGLNWTNSDVFVTAFYYRIFYQISACNEFIRQAQKATVELPERERWIAEARALRALCWLDAIDNFGNVPFADETASVGADAPRRIAREELFSYIESECRDLIDNSALYGMKEAPYGRADKALPVMVLAKLYLNAEVYAGKKMYQECADVLAELSGYSLHSDYSELFLADNDRCTDEIIFAIEQDGEDTQSYGVTNYLIFASTGGAMDTEQVGISSGWGGLRMTSKFYNYFTSSDRRRLFWEDGQKVEIDDIRDFTNGIAF